MGVCVLELSSEKLWWSESWFIVVSFPAFLLFVFMVL